MIFLNINQTAVQKATPAQVFSTVFCKQQFLKKTSPVAASEYLPKSSRTQPSENVCKIHRNAPAIGLIFGKTEGCRPATSNPSQVVFCEFLEVFQKTLFIEHQRVTAFVYLPVESSFSILEASVCERHEPFFVFVSCSLKTMYLMIYFALILLFFFSVKFLDLNITIYIILWKETINYLKQVKTYKVQKMRTYQLHQGSL